MRKLFVLLILGWLLLPLQAETMVNWGAKLGLNLSQHYGSKGDELDFEVHTAMRPGLISGAYLDLQVLPNFLLGYELLYSMKVRVKPSP